MTIIRGFHHFNEAYYAKNVRLPEGVSDEIMVGLYDTDGGTTGEFAIRWVNVSGREVPQLQAFSDSWKALGEFKDLLTVMENIEGYVTPEKFCKLLVSLGVVDLTDKGVAE